MNLPLKRGKLEGNVLFQKGGPSIMDPFTDPIELPVDGVIDLHTFRPKDIKPLLLDYFEACLEKGICEVRVIHGKGIGNLKRTVESILQQHPRVERFATASALYGGEGATMVWLRKK